MFYAGRMEAVRGQPLKAIQYFDKCVQVPKSWKNIDNICFWDMAWCHAIQLDWPQAAKYAQILKEQCNWSPATNQYQYACFLYMVMEAKGDESMRPQIDAAMALVPELKVRYAGKTIPPEKYAITKANMYIAGDKDLTLPAFELFYVWNIFAYAAGSTELCEPIMKLIEDKFEEVKDYPDQGKPLDKYCYLLLLRGVVLRSQGHALQAIDCFTEILEK